jgi:glycosyltransferase involved in cell wall biosynthesis
VKPSPDLAVVANTRLPSHRAQALQVTQMSAAFARAGATTTLFHAERRSVVALPNDKDVFDWYGVPKGARPTLRAVPCVDWIERVPRVLQYVPARLQEQTFSRNAVRAILAECPKARVLSREIETALRLVRRGHARTFLEIHRVPGGKLRRRWLLEAAAKSRGLIAISRGVYDDLVAIGVSTDAIGSNSAAFITVEHDAFEAGRFSDLPSRKAARKTLELPQLVPICVYTGGLLEWKGVDVLVEAARTLPDVYFVIAGGMESDVKRLRQKAGGIANVRIDGFQAPDRVALYLAAGDVGVVPNRSKPDISARYTSPLKIFEAMAAGLPLVASDLPSTRELLSHEENALLVAPDDAAALRAGIERLLGDTALRARLAANFAAAAAEHTWDARARRILAWMDAREERAQNAMPREK